MLPLLLVGATLASCGGDDGPATTTKTVTVATPPATERTAACREAVTKGLALVDAFSKESRGIVAPDAEDYRRRGRKIIRDARRAGCPVPKSVERQMEQFLGL